MSESKHTPGPWRFSTAYNGDNGIKADGTGVFIEAFAEIRHSGENAREEALANARLIAAAPDLLDVAKLLASLEHEDMGRTFPSKEDIAAARAAIAKAEGRS